MSDDVIARLSASAPRRVMGVGTLGLLGLLLLYLVVAETPREFAYIGFMLVIGFGALYGAHRMWMTTGIELRLTQEALVSSTGEVVCELDQIAKVDRGMFAFKPSNGFLIRLKTPMARGWAPGIWWRMGKNIGIGGVTAPAQGKVMADTLAAMLAERDGAEGR